jgi:hypothetical protein
MKMLPNKNALYLDSEALTKINYDEDKHLLEATFNNNRTYRYLKVSKAVWKDFLATIYAGASAGAFINKQIKPYYKCIEVTR